VPAQFARSRQKAGCQGERVDGGRAEQIEVPADGFGCGFLGLGRLARQGFGQRQIGQPERAGKQCLHPEPPFARAPQHGVTGVDASRALASDELVEELAPGGVWSANQQACQEISQLVRALRLRRGLFANAADRVGVELCELARFHRQPARQSHGARSALLERRIVRNEYGRLFKISWLSGDGSVLSRKCRRTRLDSNDSSNAARPLTSIASFRQSSRV
jgi:hypothetical protein